MCPDAEHAAMAGGASCEAPTDIWVEKEDSSGAAGLLLGDRSPLSQPCPPCHLMVQNSIVQYCKLLFAPFCPVGSSIAGPSPSLPLTPSHSVGVLEPSSFIPFFSPLLLFATFAGFLSVLLSDGLIVKEQLSHLISPPLLWSCLLCFRTGLPEYRKGLEVTSISVWAFNVSPCAHKYLKTLWVEVHPNVEFFFLNINLLTNLLMANTYMHSAPIEYLICMQNEKFIGSCLTIKQL